MSDLASPRVDRAVLLALAERCEREGASRELDAAIGHAIDWRQHPWAPGFAIAPPWTSSIDAAVWLSDAKSLPAVIASARSAFGKKHALHTNFFGGTVGDFKAEFARHICAESLKAKAA